MGLSSNWPIGSSNTRFAMLWWRPWTTGFYVTGDPELRPRLLEVARLADPDPWRDQVRDEKGWGNVQGLRDLAVRARPEQNTPQIVSLLAFRLRFAARLEAAALLRAALLHHPKNFWLHFSLGNVTRDLGERAGCYRAALALQPNNSAAFNNLGNVLHQQKDLEGAVACYQKARDLRPGTLLLAHYNLGSGLARPEGSGGCGCLLRRKALTLDPQFASAHINLGRVRYAQKNLEGAVACYRRALALEPRDALAHNNLGLVLYDQKQFSEAVASYRKGHEIQPPIRSAALQPGHFPSQAEEPGRSGR